MSWNDGYGDGYNKGAETFYEKGINISTEYALNNCYNYVCRMKNATSCEDPIVSYANVEFCQKLINGSLEYGTN